MVADQNRHQDDVAPAEEGGEEDQGPHGGQEEESGEKAQLLRTNQNGPKPVSAGTVPYLYKVRGISDGSCCY